MTSLNQISQKEYLKRYLSGDVKKKKKKKITGSNIKRSVIVDDDIDLKSMRPLEDDEVELYQMDEDAPQIAGIVDERPPEVKAQEYYNSKRWKVFGGEDGVNVVDSMNTGQPNNSDMDLLENCDDTGSIIGKTSKISNLERKDSHRKKFNKESDLLEKSKTYARGNDFTRLPKDRGETKSSSNSHHSKYSEHHSKSVNKNKPSRYNSDSDVSPPRKGDKNSSSDSDASPPRKNYQKCDKGQNDSDQSPPRKDSRKQSPKHSGRYQEKERVRNRNRSSSNSPPRREQTKKHKYKSDSDNSPPRRREHSYKQKSDSDASPPRKRDKLPDKDKSSSRPRRRSPSDSDNSPPRRDRRKSPKSDSDASPPRKLDKHSKYDKSATHRKDKHNEKTKSDSDASPPRKRDKLPDKGKSSSRPRRRSPSDSDNPPPRRDRRKSPKTDKSRRRSSRSRTPTKKYNNNKQRNFDSDRPNSSRRDIIGRADKRHESDSDNSPQRKRKGSEESDSDLSPPRKKSSVNDRPLKKNLYKPNDDSSSDEGSNRSMKMKTTLDGKQAGLQDAKQLKKELSDLKMKEDSMFSKMDASVSGVGAAPVKRDRKTGQIRDLEKEKEAQREKEAKQSVVNEKYYKWGRGIKQTEDAAARAAEAIKEMSKPLARYADDADLDEFLKAQEREGDPMLDYIKRKQSESTPIAGEKRIYQGPFPPNRFNIRPGCRWDGVVRSNGYEKEWFKVKNEKRARDEEAYKWSTSDM